MEYTYPRIQDVVDYNKKHGCRLLSTPPVDPRYDHAFEELVLTRSDEYHGKVPDGTTRKLFDRHAPDNA